MTSGSASGAGRDRPACGVPAPGQSPVRGGGAWWDEDDDLSDWDPDSSCPPEYAGVSAREIWDELEAEARARVAGSPPEVLTAGFLPRGLIGPDGSGAGSGGRFGFGSGYATGGALDVLEPGVSLAGMTDAATRDNALADLNDDALIGVMRAWRRLESWSAAGTLTAIAELARRRPADPPAASPRNPSAQQDQTGPLTRSGPSMPSGRPAASAPGAAPVTSPPGQSSTGRDAFPARLSEFISDEVAAALTLTGHAAGKYVDLALDLAMRLPGTARALRAGVIDYLKARLICEATSVLSDEHAAEIEARVLPTAGQQTTGQLRAALARAILALDPEAAARRREQAEKDPRVRRWQEDAGTAALAGYSLPAAEVLEADQHLTSRALDLRAAGLDGSLDELRARAYLDALLGRDSAQNTGGGTGPGSDAAPPASGHATDGPAKPTETTRHTPADQRPPGETDRPTVPGAAGPMGPAASRRLAARINLTVPLTTLLGLASDPAGVGGFGPVDAELAREVTRVAGAHPATRWCLTVIGEDGEAIGHGCAAGRRPAEVLTGGLTGRGFTVRIAVVARESCDHRHEEPSYEPSRALRHLIRARSVTCTAPGCRRPAAQCDLDHTVPYQRGGRTCECNLAPLCRHHHRCKQAEGWRLEQVSPGVMCWSTPAGRRYLTKPNDYLGP